MLHIINKSPFDSHALESCLRYIHPDDVVILIEDGVYAGMAKTTKSTLVENAIKNNEFYAISADVKARGIDELIGNVKIADYGKFVDLIEKHTVQNWF